MENLKRKGWNRIGPVIKSSDGDVSDA